MLTGQHLLVLIAAILVSNQISCAQKIETAKPVNKLDEGENETSDSVSLPEDGETNSDDSILAQSPWAQFGQNFGSKIMPFGSPLDPAGLFFPALYTFTTWSGRNFNSDLLGSPLLSSTLADSDTDATPADSKVVLVLADDKGSRNVKRSPIYTPELLRQVRQSDFAQMLSQALGQMNTLIPTPTETNSAPFGQMLSQALSPILAQIQQQQPILGQAASNTDTEDGQVAQNNGFAQIPFLSQLFASGSEISEVRVKPDAEVRGDEKMAADKLNEMKLNMMLLQTLNDKKLPILWFRDVQQKSDVEFKKTPEEMLLQQKLLAFERQVIRELRLLQEIERQSREMQAASKGMYAKVTKGTEYKLNYPLNQKPVHKITIEDIEKALADELVLKMLQKKAQMQETGKPTKRHSYQTMPFNKEEAAQLLAYALRGATSFTDKAQTNPMTPLREEALVGQQKFDSKDANMDMRNTADIQSIDQFQKNWMQPQYNEAQLRWAAEKMNYQQQERSQDQQNPLEVTGQTEVEQVNEQNNESERIKFQKKGFGFHGKGSPRPVQHYHYYLPSRSDYNSYQKPTHHSSYNSGYSAPSYSAGYRTASGNEEIDKLLETDPAWTELNRQSTTQQQQQQQLNTAMTDITSTSGRTTRLAPNVRFWLLLGEKNKKPVAGNRQKRQVAEPSMQTIDEAALNQLRATYGGALKEITLLPNEDPSEALMRYNSAAVQEVVLNGQAQPIEIDAHPSQAEVRPHVAHSTSNADLYKAANFYDKIAYKEHPVFLPQMSAGATLTAIEASTLFDSRNITQSLVTSVLEEVNRRLTSCCTKCKDSILQDIKGKLNRNEQTEETVQRDNREQNYEDWLKYMSIKGYNTKRLTKMHYDDFLQYNKMNHFDVKQTNTIKRETMYKNLSEENIESADGKTGNSLRRHVPKHIVVEQIVGGADIVHEAKQEIAQNSPYNLAYNLKHDDEIESNEAVSSDIETITTTSTVKPRRRLRRRKNKKTITTNSSTTILPTTTAATTSSTVATTTALQN